MQSTPPTFLKDRTENCINDADILKTCTKDIKKVNDQEVIQSNPTYSLSYLLTLKSLKIVDTFYKIMKNLKQNVLNLISYL